jgi:hypothetical protein
MSVYVIYPNKQDRKTSLKRIEEALNRICDGEIDGKPRTQPEALDFLRKKTEEARVAFYGREKKWIPHSTTFYRQARYLRPDAPPEDLPTQLEACINVLACYPMQPTQTAIRAEIKAFLPALKAIDKVLKTIPLLDLMKRVRLYKECVADWAKDDLKYVPNPTRFFSERRYEQDDSQWRRKSTPTYEDERNQIRRVLNP